MYGIHYMFNNPWHIAIVLMIPVVIIGLAKAWMRFKDKYAEKVGKTVSTGNTEAEKGKQCES